jgi:hypothetical protein
MIPPINTNDMKHKHQKFIYKNIDFPFMESSRLMVGGALVFRWWCWWVKLAVGGGG